MQISDEHGAPAARANVHGVSAQPRRVVGAVMCALWSRAVRAGVAAVAIGVCGVASASVVRVYEWSENGGTPVISNASPPASVKQYTIQTFDVPPVGAARPRSPNAHRAALSPCASPGSDARASAMVKRRVHIG